jgi:hypothetical protein
VARTCALVAPVRPILHRSSCSNKMVRNDPKYEFGVQWGGSGVFVAKNSDSTLLYEVCIKGTISTILHRSSCSNGTVGNGTKHESGVQRCGSGAFVEQNSDTTSLLELGH